MNSPTLLLTPAASTANAVAAPGAEAPAEEGFASALAGSIAGIARQAESACEEPLPQPAAEGDDPSLADVMQWLGLPGAPAISADPQAAGQPGVTADDLLGEAQQRLTAMAAKSALRNAPASAAEQASDSVPEGDSLALLFDSATVPESLPGSNGSAASALVTGTSSTAMQVSPPLHALGTLATALVRDGATATGTASGTAVHASLREPVGSARWADELGSRMMLMSVRGQQEGSLTLTPEHLGPLEVQISVTKDTANVWFGAQHADTRAALTEALPRLRELLAASGLSLGQAGVSDQAPRRSSSEPQTDRALSNAATDGIAAAESPQEPLWRPLRSRLIDTYA